MRIDKKGNVYAEYLVIGIEGDVYSVGICGTKFLINFCAFDVRDWDNHLRLAIDVALIDTFIENKIKNHA